jgi:hypothetical protein
MLLGNWRDKRKPECGGELNTPCWVRAFRYAAHLKVKRLMAKPKHLERHRPIHSPAPDVRETEVGPKPETLRLVAHDHKAPLHSPDVSAKGGCWEVGGQDGSGSVGRAAKNIPTRGMQTTSCSPKELFPRTLKTLRRNSVVGADPLMVHHQGYCRETVQSLSSVGACMIGGGRGTHRDSVGPPA